LVAVVIDKANLRATYVLIATNGRAALGLIGGQQVSWVVLSPIKQCAPTTWVHYLSVAGRSGSGGGPRRP
jgi:hypothetical protein